MKRFSILFISVLMVTPVFAKKIKSIPFIQCQYGIGVVYKEFVSDEDRALKVSVFYPTHDTTSFSQIDEDEVARWVRLYEDQHRNIAVNLLNRYLLPTSMQIQSDEVEGFRDGLKELHVSQKENAEVVGSLFPVVYFFPEYNLNPSSYYALIHSIVSQGYVVIATHHPEVSACITYSDGVQTCAADPSTAHISMRRDIAFLMKKLKTRDDFCRFCDFDQVAVIGHGVGGHALQACDTEEMKAVQAKVMLDNHTRDYLHGEKPSYFILSSATDSLHVAGLRNYVPSMNDHFLRVMKSLGFIDFSDNQHVLEFLGLEVPENFATLHDDFIKGLIAFLNRYMKGMDAEVPVA